MPDISCDVLKEECVHVTIAVLPRTLCALPSAIWLSGAEHPMPVVVAAIAETLISTTRGRYEAARRLTSPILIRIRIVRLLVLGTGGCRAHG